VEVGADGGKHSPDEIVGAVGKFIAADVLLGFEMADCLSRGTSPELIFDLRSDAGP
jgi:hypothetical protein